MNSILECRCGILVILKTTIYPAKAIKVNLEAEQVKHLRRFVFMGFIVLLAAVTGCEEDSNGTGPDNPAIPDNPSDLIPLSPGNSWNYNNKEYDANGNVVSSENYTLELTSTMERGGYTWYGVEDNLYITNKEDGLWLLRDGEEELGFPYPMHEGDTWTSDGWNFECMSSNVSLEIASGTYDNCLYIERDEIGSGNRIMEWWKPGLGQIKLIWSQSDGYRSVEELTGYHIEE
ncbi:hypothetical protein GF324_00690 [bacterium]|nr:hypothetical protein [bacterium]